MQSRTPEGKHTKRFIVLRKSLIDGKYERSVNIPEFFPTREEAQAAVAQRGDAGITYKVRQK
jgi:hypothetical protein